VPDLSLVLRHLGIRSFVRAFVCDQILPYCRGSLERQSVTRVEYAIYAHVVVHACTNNVAFLVN
jgi:hypothetical protein